MNKDMMPLLLLLLAEILKQQSNAIQQPGGGIDVTGILDNFSSVFDGIEFLKSEDVRILDAQAAGAAEVSVIHTSLTQLTQDNAGFQAEQRTKINSIQQSVDEIKLKINENSDSQLTAISKVNESVVEIKNNFDIRKVIEDWLKQIKDKNGKPFVGLQDFLNQQLQVFNDLSAAVTGLNEKLGLLDKIQGIDTLTSKVMALEKAVTASRKRN